MRRFALVPFLVLVVAMASAQVNVTISDIQQGPVEVGTQVTVYDAIVTGALDNDAFIAEPPLYGGPNRVR